MHIRPSTVAVVVAVMATLASLVTTPAYAFSGAGTDSRPWPEQLFASDSFWYRRLPASTPLDPQSGNKIAYLKERGIIAYGNQWRQLPSMNINTNDYTPPLYVARNTDPVVTFNFNDCQGKGWLDPGLREQLSNLHVPAEALPAQGTDAEMTVYNADTRQYTDTWVTSKSNGQWSACWGGTMRDAKANNGVFPWPYGTTAAGFPFAGGTIMARELQRGQINHVIGIALPVENVSGVVSSPANRTDGSSGHPYALAEGQMLRLPASLDIDAMKLSPTAKTVAKAAQQYGIIVWDRAGDISFRAENPQGLRSDPYPTLFAGKYGYEVLWGDPGRGEEPFPFERLQALQVNYSAPVTTPTQPLPPGVRPPASRRPAPAR